MNASVVLDNDTSFEKAPEMIGLLDVQSFICTCQVTLWEINKQRKEQEKCQSNATVLA